MTGLVASTCPSCGAAIEADPRFVVWCHACDWNVDPTGARPEPVARGREARAAVREERRKAKAHNESARLHARLASNPAAVPHRGRTPLLAFAIAGVVHAVTLAMLASGVWFVIISKGTSFGLAIGLFFLALAAMLRPRLGRLGKHEMAVPIADLPGVASLVAEIGGRMGSRRSVSGVVVSSDVNVGIGVLGVRSRAYLFVGLPLWAALSPQERVFVLGHELGHDLNGDPARGWFLRTSVNALRQWGDLGPPATIRRRRGRSTEGTVSSLLAGLAMAPVRWSARKLAAAQHRLVLRSSQQAEYFADRVAARVAGGEASRSGLEKLYLGDGIGRALQRAVAAGDTRDVMTVVRTYVASIPVLELERLRRVGVLRAVGEDSTHPATPYRVSLLTSFPPDPPAVVLSDEASARIDAELLAAWAHVRRELRRR